MAQSEFVVSSVKVTRGPAKARRISFGISTDVTDDGNGPWFPIDGYTLAAWRVRCTTKAEAAGIVMHWLASGRPSGMDVRQVFLRETSPISTPPGYEPQTKR